MSSELSSDGVSGLRHGAVGLWGDVVASVTTLSPTAAIALALAALVGASGYASPLAMLIAGAINLCCAVGIMRLGHLEESAAAPVFWVGRRLSPILGFSTGIMLIVLTIIANIGNVTVLGSTLLNAIDSSLATHKPLVWLAAALLTAAITAIATIGVRITIRAQAVVAVVEYAIVTTILVAAFVHIGSAHGAGYTHPSWSWLTGSGTSFESLLAGIVVGTFLIGGWEAPIYLGSEQRRAGDPGRSVVISVVFATLWLTLLIVGFSAVAPASLMATNADNMLPFLASRTGLGSAFGTLAAVAVILALTTTLQGQLVDGSRVAFGMARVRLLPGSFGRTHPRFRTPVTGLVVGACIPVLALIVYLASGSAAVAVVDIAGTGGLMFATYYAWLALFAAWTYRSDLRSVGWPAVLAFIPFAGAGAFVYAIVRDVPGESTAILIIWGVLSLIGIPLALITKRLTGSPFFDRPAIRETGVSAPAGNLPDLLAVRESPTSEA